MAGAMIVLPASAAKITAVKVGSKINVTIDGKYFTSYIFSEDEKYPFFYPVNGPVSGGSVTSMRNAVYPHHTSLFFGCDLVNGGNYWQEGLERGRIISVNAQIEKQGGDSCSNYRRMHLEPARSTVTRQGYPQDHNHIPFGNNDSDRCGNNYGNADGCSYPEDQPFTLQRQDGC